MRNAMMVVGLLLATGASAQENRSLVAEKVAQVVTLAREAAILCPTLAADDDQIRALLGEVKLTEQDLMPPGRYAAQDQATARSFADSVAADPAGACGDLEHFLGQGAAKLVRKKE